MAQHAWAAQTATWLGVAAVVTCRPSIFDALLFVIPGALGMPSKWYQSCKL